MSTNTNVVLMTRTRIAPSESKERNERARKETRGRNEVREGKKKKIKRRNEALVKWWSREMANAQQRRAF